MIAEVPKTNPVCQHFKPSTPGNSDTRSKKVDLAIFEIIATDIHPFTVVSAIGFKRLMALLESRYSVKT